MVVDSLDEAGLGGEVVLDQPEGYARGRGHRTQRGAGRTVSGEALQRLVADALDVSRFVRARPVGLRPHTATVTTSGTDEFGFQPPRAAMMIRYDPLVSARIGR